MLYKIRIVSYEILIKILDEQKTILHGLFDLLGEYPSKGSEWIFTALFGWLGEHVFSLLF